MAKNFKSCAIDGCNGNAHYSANGKRGWCQKHHARWYRNGDPLAGQPLRASPGERLAWLQDHAAYDGEGCLIFPFEAGYSEVRVDGEYVGTHRHMCEIVKGPAPSPDHEAAHSCGNGHLGCVHPKHLRWATRSENKADMVQHGTDLRGSRHGMAKLTDDQVQQIRALKGIRTQVELAAMFGITQTNVSLIQSEKSWRFTGRNPQQPQYLGSTRPLSPSQ